MKPSVGFCELLQNYIPLRENYSYVEFDARPLIFFTGLLCFPLSLELGMNKLNHDFTSFSIYSLCSSVSESSSSKNYTHKLLWMLSGRDFFSNLSSLDIDFIF